MAGFRHRLVGTQDQIASRGPQWPGATASAIGQEWLVTAGTALAPRSHAHGIATADGPRFDVGHDLDNVAAYHRWAGYDLHLRAPGGLEWVAFAPNTDSTVPTVLIPADTAQDTYVVLATHIAERAHTWIALPPLHLDRSTDYSCEVQRVSSSWTPTVGRRIYAPTVTMPRLMTQGVQLLVGLPAARGLARAVGYISPPPPDAPFASDFQVEVPHGPPNPPAASVVDVQTALAVPDDTEGAEPST